MNRKQKSAIQSGMGQLREIFGHPAALKPLMNYLRKRRIISDEEIEELQNVVISSKRVKDLFQLIQNKDGSWEALTAFFRDNGYQSILRNLGMSASTAGKSAFMDDWDAVEMYKRDLVKVLEWVVEYFLIELQINAVLSDGEIQDIESKISTKRKILRTLKIVKHKDGGLKAILDVLRNHGWNSLADKIEAAAGKRSEEENPDFMDSFTLKLQRMYKSEYSWVTTLFKSQKKLEEVWVPLTVVEKTRGPWQTDFFDHSELLKQMTNNDNDNCNYPVLVKGHPGVGKTTLVKKIAYDWATDATDAARQFDLVLILFLKEQGRTTDFRQLAADYYADRLGLKPGENKTLLDELERMGLNLLICLDGLDEYESFADCPLKNVFESTFKTSAASADSPQPRSQSSPHLTFMNYRLLLTSRPYACELIPDHFVFRQFEVCKLDDEQLTIFVQQYCETEKGREEVLQYLEGNGNLIIQVPLILVYICYLADSQEKIPGNLTLLYEKFLSEMIERQIGGPTDFIGKINVFNWTELKSIAGLAFEGCKNDKFQFSQALQDKFTVTKDSYLCGFLLYKFDFHEKCLIADFAHRSIQEFFGALHCYQLMLEDNKAERNCVMKEILNEESQLGRFFFGISSQNDKFREMLEWLNPTFDAVKMTHVGYSVHFLSVLSASLSDCKPSDCELFGRRLAASLDKIQITEGRNHEMIMHNRITNTKLLESTGFNFLTFNKGFQSGLNMKFFEKNSWYLSQNDNSRLARLTFLSSTSTLSLCENFDEIKIFLCERDINGLARILSSWDRLPHISTLMAIKLSNHVDCEVNFRLKYTDATPPLKSKDGQMQNFTLLFGKEMKDKFSNALHPTDLFRVESQETDPENGNVHWATVVVTRNIEQHEQLKHLVRLARKIDDPLWKSKPQSAEIAERPLADESAPGDATQERILQEKQNRVLQNHLEELSSVLSPTLILTHLSLKRIITKQEEQMITKDPENFLDAAKIKALFHLMSRDPQWWDILMKYLEDHRYGIHKRLKEDLKKMTELTTEANNESND